MTTHKPSTPLLRFLKKLLWVPKYCGPSLLLPCNRTALELPAAKSGEGHPCFPKASGQHLLRVTLDHIHLVCTLILVKCEVEAAGCSRPGGPAQQESRVVAQLEPSASFPGALRSSHLAGGRAGRGSWLPGRERRPEEIVPDLFPGCWLPRQPSPECLSFQGAGFLMTAWRFCQWPWESSDYLLDIVWCHPKVSRKPGA